MGAPRVAPASARPTGDPLRGVLARRADAPPFFPKDSDRREAPTMAYDRDQATHEFTRWSESYDRCILQWLLFGPSHRAIITRIRGGAGGRPVGVSEGGCGPGLFAARIRAALPEARVWGIDLVSGMLTKGV